MSVYVASERTRASRRAARLSRAFALAGGAVAAVAVAGTALADGGYYPTAWGPTAIALAWAASLGLLLREEIRLSRIELLALAALAAYALWVGASALWSPSVEASVLELQRTLVYVAGFAAMLLLTRRRGYRALLTGAWAAAAFAGGYALLLRLYPGPEGLTSTVAGYRQDEPVGYWNGLAVLCSMGIVLALGQVAHARPIWLRALAGASVVPMTLTLYFTFSRGGWIALAIGIAVALVLDSRRLHFALALAAAGPWAAIAVRLASEEPGLTRIDAAAQAAEAGRRLAPTVAVLLVAAAVCAGLLFLLERAVPFGPAAERRFAAGAALAMLFVLGIALVRFGGPAEIARDSWRAFNAPPVRIEGDLNERLFDFSGGWRVELWRVGLQELRERPLLGRGGGTYEQAWLRERPIGSKVRNAHSVYVETLAETGVVGALLLAGALAPALVGAVAARRRRLVPAAAGAYVLFLVHAAIDWDWELPAVTLAAFACAAAILAAGRGDDAPLLPALGRRIALGLAIAVALAALAGFFASRALDEAGEMVATRRWAAADAAGHRALTWAPWSAEAWLRIGQAQVARERYAAGERSIRRAIARDPQNWSLWFDLALATVGREQLLALARAEQLNPLSIELAQFREGVIARRR